MPSTACARVIYWKARPGQFDRYSDYLRREVEPIDHEAQRRGILTRFCTLVDRRPDAPWTHMRLFEFANPAQRDALVPALATVVAALTPDPRARENRARLAVTLRDKMGEANFDLLE